MRPARLHVLAALILLGGTTVAHASVNYVFYSVEKVKWGTAEHQLALPRTFPSQPDLTPSAIASEAFHKLQSYRGGAYEGTALTLDPNFASTGAATVAIGEAAQAELAVVISEVFWTLRAAGVREIRIPSVSNEALTDSQVPFGAAMIVVELWQVLPPGKAGTGYVFFEGGLQPAFEIQERIEKREKNVVAAILGLLGSPIAYVRLNAVAAVSAMNLPKVEAALIPLLKDPDSAVKAAVLKGFEGSRSKPVLAALEEMVQTDPDATMQSGAARILSAAGISKYAIIVLYDKLKDPDDAVVMDAVGKLAASGKPEVAGALVGVLTHRNSRAREMAMTAIVELKNTDAWRKIVETEAIDMNFRNQAGRLLAEDTGENVELGLRHLLAHGPTAERVWAVEKVAEGRLYKLVTDVIGLLGGDDGAVRVASAKALGSIKDSKALGPLAKALVAHEAEREHYETAIIAIFAGLSVDEVIRFSSDEDKILRQLSIRSLAKFTEGGRPQPKILEVLKQRLGDSDKDIRRSAAFALARIKDPGVVASLVVLKDDADPTIREQVAIAVTASGHADADAILTSYMSNDSNATVRRTAIDGLRIRGVKAALEKLRFQVEHPNVEVRRAVLHATVKLAGAEGWDEWFPIWSKALYDLDPEVKIFAVTGISYRGTDARVPSLIGGLATDPDARVQVAALEALGKTRAKEAIEYVARALFEGSPDVKLAALAALGAINLEECGKPIQDFVRVETDTALVARANEVYDGLP